MRVLAIEDDPNDYEILRVKCEARKDIAVDWARTLHEAREFCTRIKYDAIILDLALPDANSEVTHAFAMEMAAHTQVMIWTGRVDADFLFLDAPQVEVFRKGTSEESMLGRFSNWSEPLRQDVLATQRLVHKLQAEVRTLVRQGGEWHKFLFGNGQPGLIAKVQTHAVMIETVQSELTEHKNDCKEHASQNIGLRYGIIIAVIGAVLGAVCALVTTILVEAIK